jgi:glutamate/tyrosine decarboxylase-like PLP-dependent enzyme
MPDRPDPRPDPAARSGSGPAPDGFLEAFGWHPEPELLGIRDAAVSREALRAAGAATWEAALDYLYDHALVRGMGEPAGYAELRAAYFGAAGGPGPAPDGPTPLPVLLEEFRDRVAPHTVSAWHPRSYGYFTPPPLIASVLGEILAQVTQQGVDVWHAGPVAAFVEEEVIRWLCDLVGYGRGSFGLLTSGGVMANFIAMTLARDVHASRVLRLDRPPRGRALESLRIYTSDQTHFSIGRAIDELGFPPECLVLVPADDDFRLRGADVAAAVAADRAAGLTPIAISAVAGATNTGSVDAVGELADVAEREDLWLHVDAAYGAAVRLSARDASRVPDLERAHSVTVDPHKWFFQAYDIGGLMVRRGADLEAVFGSRRPEYYRSGHAPMPSGEDDTDAHAVAGHGEAGQLNFWKLGFEGTRRWRALKLWLSWKHVGTAGFGRLVEANIDLAAHLGRRVAADPEFEALPPVPPLSVACFRYRPAGLAAGPDLDALQDRIQAALEESGDGWLSTTRLRGGTWLRAGILNTQATIADVDRLIEDLRELGSGDRRQPSRPLGPVVPAPE